MLELPLHKWSIRAYKLIIVVIVVAVAVGGFDIPIDIIQVILKMIFPVNYLTGAKTWSSQQIAWFVPVNEI